MTDTLLIVAIALMVLAGIAGLGSVALETTTLNTPLKIACVAMGVIAVVAFGMANECIANY